MPHLRDEVGVQQPESLFIGDLRAVTTAYETSVAALFRSVVHENMALRRQLATAGLDPPTMAADGATWGLAMPPRPVAPVSQDWLCAEECPEFGFMPLGGDLSPGGEGSPKFRRSKSHEFTSEGCVVPRPSERSSGYGSNTGGAHPRYLASASNLGNRFMPGASILGSQGVDSASLDFEVGNRGSLPSERRGLARVVKSCSYEYLISGCIIFNCVTVSLWAHNLATGSWSSQLLVAIEVAEHTFVAIFTLDILLKLKALGCRAFNPVDSAGRSNFTDMMLLFLTGILPQWIVPVLAWNFHFDGTTGTFRTLSVLRTVRLTRLVRVFQRLPLFRGAWMLVHGLSDSYRTLFWTCMVIFLVTYVFAIVGLATVVVELEAQLAYRTDPEDVGVIKESLKMMKGVDQMMLCLVQVLFSDSYHAFMRPLLTYIWWSWLFWYSYVAVAGVVLMNLVTAVIVDNAMETSRDNHDHMVREKEAKRRRDIDRLCKLFNSMDIDGGGTLSWEEFSMSFEDPELGKIWKVLDVEQKDAWEIFQLLDDGDGEITINEFIEALHRMSGVAQAKDVFRLHKMVFLVINTLDAFSASAKYKLQARSGGIRGIEFSPGAGRAR